MKLLLISLCLFVSFSAFAQVWDHAELSQALGYDSNILKNKFLKPSEQEAIDKYSAYKIAYYEDINPYLRGQKVDYEYAKDEAEIKYLVQEIDRGISKVPELPKNLILFRGEGLSYRGNKPPVVGEVMVQKAYASTSTSEKEAKEFITVNGVLFILYSTQAKFNGIAINDFESEVLLPRNQIFKVMNIRPLKDKGIKESAFVALVQICKSINSCEKTVTNKYAKAIWESDSF